MQILFKITPQLLKIAGYRKMPSHSYSKRKVDEHWITQSKWNKNEFPRFEVEKTKKEWTIHFDYFKETEHKQTPKAKL